MDGIFEFTSQVQFSSAAWIFMLPLFLMVIDFISGFANAWVKNEVSSPKMRIGLVKKLGEVLMLVVGELIVYGTSMPWKSDIMSFISIYLSLMEAISIFENLALLGVPIPGFIKTSLKETQDMFEKENHNENSSDRDSGDSTSSDK